MQSFKIKIDVGIFFITSAKVYIFVANSKRNQVKMLRKKRLQPIEFRGFLPKIANHQFFDKL